MILYIVKVIACSALFLLVYKLLLEKERMHRFNRFYLLMSVAGSFIVPLLSFTVYTAVLPETEPFFLITAASNPTANAVHAGPVAATNVLPAILWSVYGTIAVFFLARFTVGLRTMMQAIAKGLKIPYKEAKLVLTGENTAPYSFLNYIFLWKEEYNSGCMRQEILLHELTHVRQKHSFDMLFVKIVRAFFWCNPFWILYEKAIRLNHEFLADAAVINNCNDTTGYQYLLLAKAGGQSGTALASRFSYSITKKRFIMMTKTTSGKAAAFKQMAATLSFAVVILLFGARVNAQAPKDRSIRPDNKIAYGSGASQDLLTEYDTTLRHVIVVRRVRNGKMARFLDMSKCNEYKMAKIYRLMNKEQRDARDTVVGKEFISITTPPFKRSPAPAMLQQWRDPAKYGVWLDGKRIENAVLKDYKATDFCLFWVSKLEKNAVNYGKHYYQVDLYTPAYYEKAYVTRSN